MQLKRCLGGDRARAACLRNKDFPSTLKQNWAFHEPRSESPDSRTVAKKLYVATFFRMKDLLLEMEVPKVISS